MNNFSLQYPSWFLFFCLLAAVFYAGAMYFRSRNLEGNARLKKGFLALCRALAAALLVFLLLDPMLRDTEEDVKKPKIAVLHDVSQSVGQWVEKNPSSAPMPDINALKAKLSERYEVNLYDFGANVRPHTQSDSLTYNDLFTDIHSALGYAVNMYEGDNLGAIVLATDGIYNDGRNPAYFNNPQKTPIYSIALGDTTRKRDVQVKSVLANSIAYLYDEMMTMVDIQAYNASNQRSRLTVQKILAGGQNETIHEEDITITSDNFFTTRNVKLSFDTPGTAQYRFRLSTISLEENIANNIKDLFIEVLDARQHISIVASAPHPDLAALKSVLSANKNYEVNTYTRRLSPQEMTKTDLVIWHNTPTANMNIDGMMEQFDRTNTPMMFFVGDKTEIAIFNKIQDIYTLRASTANTTETQAGLTRDFSLFTLTDKLQRLTSRFPPVHSPFGDYQVNSTTVVLMNQKIGGIETDYPLLAFSDKNGKKKTFFFATGIWRWRLYDYLENENFDIISELLDKTISYTSTKEDKRRFRASSLENIILENQEVQLIAELYNNSYVLVNESEVSLSLTDPAGDSYEYVFDRTDKYYSINIGRLTPGRYSFKASTFYGGENFESTGSFTVREIQYELAELTAQHDILYSLAEQTEATVYYPGQWDLLSDQLLNDNRLKPVIFATTTSRSLMDKKAIFFVIALLLGIEWFLRRYWGSL